MRKALLFAMLMIAGCSTGDSPEVQAEKTANEKAGPPPAGVTPTDIDRTPHGATRTP